MFILNNKQCLVLLVYVDDFLITGTSEEDITKVKIFLHKLITVKDISYAKYFLGLEIVRSLVTYFNQWKYFLDIVKNAGLIGAKLARIPLPRGIIYSTNNSTLLTDPKRYRRFIGHLLYLNLTRPDISFVVQQLSQFVNTPCQKHCDAAIHILLILEIVRQTTFLFFNNNVSIIAYCNADWGSCANIRRSLTKFVYF